MLRGRILCIIYRDSKQNCWPAMANTLVPQCSATDCASPAHASVDSGLCCRRFFTQLLDSPMAVCAFCHQMGPSLPSAPSSSSVLSVSRRAAGDLLNIELAEAATFCAALAAVPIVDAAAFCAAVAAVAATPAAVSAAAPRAARASAALAAAP